MKRVFFVVLTFLLHAFVPAESFAGDGIKTAGDILQFVPPVAGGGMALWLRDGDGGLDLAESLGVTVGVTYGLKYTVTEKRPNGGSHSFPSGHTAGATSGAEFLRERYGWEYGVPAYVVAAFVGYSRVESKELYTHDVLAGAAIGGLSSYFLTESLSGLGG